MTCRDYKSGLSPSTQAIWRCVLVVAGLCGGAEELIAEQSATKTDSKYQELIRSTPGLLYYASFDGDSTSVQEVVEGESELGVASAYPSLGTALHLQAGFVRVPEFGLFDAASVEMWLKLEKDPTSGIAALFAVNEWEGGFLHLNLLPSGRFELAVNGVNGYPKSDPGSITVGRWSHVVYTYDRSAARQRLFVNGRMVLEQSIASPPQLRLLPATVGAWINGQPTRHLAATIDELAVYSTALPIEVVRRHFQIGKGIVPAPPVDFATAVQPILRKHCYSCHGQEKQEAQLRLDIRDVARRGGESGEPAFVPYDAELSHLITRVATANDDERMPPEGDRLTNIEIQLLRSWIDQGALWPDALAGQEPVESVTTRHWSFQPVRSSPINANDVSPHALNAIDSFISVGLKKAHLEPSPPADRRTRIRRLYLDTLGLPPTAEEVEEFAADESHDGWSRLVDRVLASPRFGERWASHWLDVIRYGDTHGFEVNTPRANAWPYRDYVIDSFNSDRPYDQFLREQLLGDQLGVDVATGFLVAAPALLQGQVGKDAASIRLARADELNEILVSVGSGVLGLTVACARCHNHKFDPISQQDYYRMQAVFAGVNYGDRSVIADGEANYAWKKANTVFAGTFAQPGPVHRLYRGDPMQTREQMSPSVPAVLGSLELESSAPEVDRRRRFAEWLVSTDHPLTPRVIVNRIWQHHFGKGLVSTPSDFGAMGQPPSHPELLDWLAAELIRRNWSLKEIHRLILNSATYQQSSFPDASKLQINADNSLLWRYSPRRLDMEPIRDSILAVCGSLDLTMGGAGFDLFQPNDNYVRVYEPKTEWKPTDWRRMIYAHRVRMELDGVFGGFDCPDAGQPAPRRGRSTTALQALSLMNSTFMQQQADFLATRAASSDRTTVEDQLDFVFREALGRLPSELERSSAAELSREFGLSAVCRAILNSNEFLFIP